MGTQASILKLAAAASASYREAGGAFGSQTSKAQVISIVEEGQIVLNGQSQLYQIMDVEILDGPYQGTRTNVDFALGDKIYVSVGQTPSGQGGPR